MRNPKYHPKGCWCASCKEGRTGPRPEGSNFQRGSGSFICEDCGKRTRKTPETAGSISIRLCPYCEARAGLENSLSDGHITTAQFDEQDAALKARYGRS